MKRKLLVILNATLLAGMAFAFPAQAAYKYTTVDYPGALCTALSGIRNAVGAVGYATFTADCTGTAISFVYNSTNGAITPLPTAPGAVGTMALGVNQAGVFVGSAGDGTVTTDVGFLLYQGAFTFFAHPGALQTQGRAIGNSGLVTGFSNNSAGNYIPFLYDPTHNSFVDITFPGLLPFPAFSTAQGINGKGEVVGNFNLDPNSVYAGSPRGSYGFLRDSSEKITLFRVNGYRTRARGITESGRIAGFVTDDTEKNRGFVVTLKARGGFQALTIPDSDLLDPPGSVETFVSGIDELGRVSGNWTDAGGGVHGFLATPTK